MFRFVKASLVLLKILQGCQILLADVTLEKPQPLMNRLNVEVPGQLLTERPLAELALEVFQLQMNVTLVRSQLDPLRKPGVTVVTFKVLDAEMNALDVILQNLTPTKRDVTTIALEPGRSVEDLDVTRATRKRRELHSADLTHLAANSGVAQVTLVRGLEVEPLVAALAPKVTSNRFLPDLTALLYFIGDHVELL